MKKVAVINHGCKLNQFEGEAIAHSFEEAGFTVVEEARDSHPDVTVINTCTVTGKSDRKSRNSIMRAVSSKREGGLVVVTGCYAETDGADIRKLKGVDLVCGNGGKASLAGIVMSALENGIFPEVPGDSAFLYNDPLKPSRSRVYVKVQDGCSMCCSYCKIPLARGESRSREHGGILSYVRDVTRNGYEEIVLTGVNLGDYRDGNVRLPELLSLILEMPGSFRVRLSSIEAVYFTGDLLGVIRDERVVPHFHVPMQSGSDRILRLMKRPYSVSGYMELIHEIGRLRPGCHLATDVIVGFPTESGTDFEKTVEAVSSARFSSMHVFRYSPRAGTEASCMADDVSAREKAQRSERLLIMRDRLNYLYRRAFLGSVLDAVFEKSGDSWYGVTGNYIRVKLKQPGEPEAGENLERKRLPVRITEVGSDYTIGELAQPH